MKEVGKEIKEIEITILFPCLNEEKTVSTCVHQALDFLRESELEGEVLVCDNGSEDASVLRAEEAGARVVICPDKGYGNTLRYGISKAEGKYIIMGDCDCSYRFDRLGLWMKQLREGTQLIVGDRFGRRQEPGAMPFWHRHLGVPLLSFLGRKFLGSEVRDFHCGLRAVNKRSFLELNCRYGGMEFATEMIGRAEQAGQKIGQIPVRFYRDQRGRPSHLRSIRDGFRHLKVIVTRCGCPPF